MHVLNMEGLANLLGADEAHEVETITELQAHARALDLRERLEALNTEYVFKMGDLVRWKPGLKHKKSPLMGEPAIITEVLAQTVRDDSDPSSCYYRENLDVKIAVIREGDFLEFHFDSRRLEPFPETEL